MASIRRKSAAVALAVVGIAGLTLASAAQLNVNSSSLGAGTSVVAACQPTTGPAMNVKFTTEWTGATANVTEVKLSSVAAACEGLAYSVQLTGAGNVALGSPVDGTALTLTSGGVTIPVAATAASDVQGVAIVIHG